AGTASASGDTRGGLPDRVAEASHDQDAEEARQRSTVEEVRQHQATGERHGQGPSCSPEVLQQARIVGGRLPQPGAVAAAGTDRRLDHAAWTDRSLTSPAAQIGLHARMGGALPWPDLPWRLGRLGRCLFGYRLLALGRRCGPARLAQLVHAQITPASGAASVVRPLVARSTRSAAATTVAGW